MSSGHVGTRLHDPAQRRLVAALLLAGSTVSFMSTLGIPLIPGVQREHDLTHESAQWVLTVTLLTGAIATPVLGRLADGALRRRVLVGTLLAVFAGSVLAATAESFLQLLVGRGLQGTGYAIIPVAVATVREHTTGSRRNAAIASLSVTVAIGAGIGYPVTGALVDHLGQAAAFWFAALVSGAAAAAVMVTVPRGREGHAPLGVDLAGAILVTTGLTALLLSVSRAVDWGWSSASLWGLLTLALVVLSGWLLVELRHSHPLIDVRLVSRPEIVGANVAALLLSAGMFMGITLISTFAQTPEAAGYGFGASLTVAGLLLLPLAAGSVLAQPVADRAAARFGSWGVLAGGSAVVALTLLLLVLVDAHRLAIAVASGFLGVGVGCTFAAMPRIIVDQVPSERTGSALSLNQVLRSVGGAVGSAASATIIALHHPAGSAFPDEAGYTVALVAAAAACLLTAVLVVALGPAGRWSLAKQVVGR